MGFFSGGANIAIVTALLDFFVFSCVNIYQFTGLIYLLSYACLGLQFLDVETNPGPGVLFLVSAEYSAVMCGAYPGT